MPGLPEFPNSEEIPLQLGDNLDEEYSSIE